MGSDNGKRGGPTASRRLAGLLWLTPISLLPHGVTGALALLLGVPLVLESLFGRHWLLESGWAVPVYAMFAAANSVAGLAMALRMSSWKWGPFAVASIVQLCLLWCCWRFRPRIVDASGAFWLERVVDAAAGFSLLGMILAMLAVASRLASDSLAVGAAVCGGCFGLLLLSAYPVHLALGGDEWIACVVEQYPKQLQGMSGYIYVPATWMFAAMLFGATLLDRKVISGVTFGGVFGGGIGVIILTTVLTQELHIPVVSTQRIILPCPEAPPGSALDALVRRLDTSVLAQTALRAVGAL